MSLGEALVSRRRGSPDARDVTRRTPPEARPDIDVAEVEERGEGEATAKAERGARVRQRDNRHSQHYKRISAGALVPARHS